MGFIAGRLKAFVVASTFSGGDFFSLYDVRNLNQRHGRDERGVRTSPLFAASGTNNLSAAAQERREEEKRRRDRTDDVVVGQTSAISGSSDYALDVDATREQWLRQASPSEQEIFRKTELGMEMLRMLRLEEASEAFARVFELKPDAYLWQAGIARFYLDDWNGAAEIFARCAAIYEERFEEPASEERIWRNACMLKKLTSLNRRDRKAAEQGEGVDRLVAQVPLPRLSPQIVKAERRKVVRITQELFQSSVDKDHVTTIMSRAKLHSIGGSFDVQTKMDKKLWRISSWYYLGLHCDALGDYSESKNCIKMALRLRPNANSSDLIHALPMLHMTCRNWFDDESFCESDASAHDAIRGTDTARAPVLNASQPLVPTNPLFLGSIRSSLQKMRHVDLQEVLRMRGLRTIGSKDELQARLFDSLITDTSLPL